MRSFEFTAMQKAEAEQKARLKERKRLWTEHVAANPYGYHANCKNQIEIEEFIDLLFKLKQEREQMRARAERERAEMEREEREAESWNARNERNTIRTEREVRRQVDTRRNME
ncbi:hypothetical protein AGMMS49990_10050 [Endomicrobiia bacterium]|nr:hypothetical protein AGMMS49990_10050 [Endomicrobiia bacterium]